eukprot:gene4565-313_t
MVFIIDRVLTTQSAMRKILLVLVLVASTYAGKDFRDPEWKHGDLCDPPHQNGYPCEHHTIVTADGFELGAVRLPPKSPGAYPVFLQVRLRKRLKLRDLMVSKEGGRNRSAVSFPPVTLSHWELSYIIFEELSLLVLLGGQNRILQHGLLDSAITWMFNYNPYQNLAYILHDKGYDVWLGNSRGNVYSMTNKKLSGTDYWDAIDMDKMASEDLPANIDYVLAEQEKFRATNRSTLSYVGHSQGTWQAFSAFSTSRKDMVPKVDFYGALAPVTYVGHQTSIILSVLADVDLAKWISLFGIKEFLPNDWLIHEFSEVCKARHISCPSLLWILTGGGNITNINGTRLPFLTDYDPGGTSVINMEHWSSEPRMTSSDDAKPPTPRNTYLHPYPLTTRLQATPTPTPIPTESKEQILAVPQDI